jgi:cellobiose transport system permease protein
MKTINKLLLYTFLVVSFFLSVFPFYWMFVIGSRTTAEANQFPPVMIPGDKFLVNFNKALDSVNFFGALLNSVFVTVTITAAQLFFSSLAAFAISKLRFRGKKILFIMIISTLMIPAQLGLVPSYLIITKLGWLNDFRAVIVPALVSAFGVFWLKQYMDSTVHEELIESSRIDGATNFQTYWRIALPLVMPAMATLAILTFMQVWNDFLWPSIVLRAEAVQTIQIALRNLNDVYYRDVAMIMAGTFVATLPLLLVFLFFNRYFIAGITSGAVKE